MSDERKQKLVDRGPEILADTLMELSNDSKQAEDLVNTLTATSGELIEYYKSTLAGIKRSRRFIHYSESFDFAKKLSMLLQTLKASVSDPLKGLELVADFYKADSSVFGRCDDSAGVVGDVFNTEAKALFLQYASECNNKKKIAGIILKLNRKDEYGVRNALIDCADNCLPETIIRTMIKDLQKWVGKEEDEHRKSHYTQLIESLADQIGDAELFEKTRINSSDTLSTASCVDIAQVWLKNGDTETSYKWLQKIPEDEGFLKEKRDNLLKVIYQLHGNNEKLSALLYQQFERFPSEGTLRELLDHIGHDKREEVINKKIAKIMHSENLNLTNVDFLLSVSKIDEAENYIIQRAAQLDGNLYGHLLDLVKMLESEKRYLVTSLIYRSLLLSILERAYYKAYPYAARYLRKLDELEACVTDWKNFDDHDKFKSRLLEVHGRKQSFWSKYEQKSPSKTRVRRKSRFF